MSKVALYLPWCPLDGEYQVGRISFVPFLAGENIPDAGAEDQNYIEKDLQSYRDRSGSPITEATVIRFADRGYISEISDAEMEEVDDALSLLCFSALAGRAFFTASVYCNAACFQMVVQRASGPQDIISLRISRVGGTLRSGWPVDEVQFGLPVECEGIRDVRVDGKLLEALASHLGTLQPRELRRWRNAIACFNQASTDRAGLRVSYVLLCSAFQVLLSAGSDGRDVAHRLEEDFRPETTLNVGEGSRSIPGSRDERSLRYTWMKSFYDDRGPLAHGADSRPPEVIGWTRREHEVLSAISFPLLVRGLLSRAGAYKLGDSHRAQIDSFEGLVGTEDFMNPVPGERTAVPDFAWSRLIRERTREISSQRLREALAEAAEESEEPPE